MFKDLHLFLIVFLVGLIFLFIPVPIKFSIFTISQGIVLTPLNLARNYFSNLQSLREENKRLKAQLIRLSLEKRRGTANIEPMSTSEFALQHAEIVGRDPNSLIQFLLINKGSLNNIRPMMPVVTENGIVGRVRATTLFQSVVETFYSPDFKVAAQTQTTKTAGVVTFIPETHSLQIRYLPVSALIILGDTVITSGVGGVFPKGLKIGTIVKISESADGFTKEILLKSLVDILKLEEVFIIISPKEKKVEKPRRLKTDWEKTLEELKLEPPLEIRTR